MRNQYILKVATGAENQVVEYLKKLIVNNNIERFVFNPNVPERITEKIVRGKKKEVKTKCYPGYVFIEMDISDNPESENFWKKITRIILSTSGVSSFLGVKRTDKPIQLTKSEVKSYLMNIGQMKEEISTEYSDEYSINDEVSIVDGAFKNCLGLIKEIDKEKKKVTVEVKIFDRPTPVDLYYYQIEKK